ncbi:uncharacterized protein GGS25DRAFT_524327 [Hypoxylon fragiforme]|uniref:uncharacterized protein n=1 Tax=Hypoxylon fragiforme TaxID=63214 RepID=UPI0020C67ACB|nr:uncharacterized protein GGS25DRAFT_524327 [Hypoxylon fragiforme]KAI2604833.1 hypothetical protein GGS25DRAFT_524327 [Hypoxylon fragiforme]
MPPKSNATAARDTAALGSLIASEVRMIDSIFRNSCSKSKPTMTNWAKVTAELGFKNEKSTKDTFRHICKKHKWYESEDNESAAPKAPTTPESKDKKDRDGPTTPNSKRLRSPASGEEADAKGTPTTKKRKAAPRSKRSGKPMAKHESTFGNGTSQGEDDLFANDEA